MENYIQQSEGACLIKCGSFIDLRLALINVYRMFYLQNIVSGELKFYSIDLKM
jgi:hypothetical protein